ncbi:MAG TPA: AbrB/MazE/SpoVT family DNA-binding domain-containing protein [Anaerolineaceae bacterium]|nr:AbrB/MazE/SpoVT family DNA-binding domain-containing protein [Anaerolineaceae bacterium]
MIRRLFRTGNSVVLSLPREVLDDLNLAEGESVNLEVDLEKRRILLTPVEKLRAESGVNEEFARQVDEFIRLYRPALEKLAK